MYYYGVPMNKIAFVFFVLFTALSIHAAIQIEVIGIFQGHRDNRQQWVEVKNNSNSTVDIAGFSLQLEKEVLFRFSPNTILRPQEIIRIFIVDSAPMKNELYTVRKKRLFTGRFYSPEESNDFIKHYEVFRTFENNNERCNLYSRLLPVLHRVPIILERLYVKTPDGNVEDAILATNIFINRHEGYALADLTKIGLMPLTFLVREGNAFVNRQSLVLPKTFTVNDFRLGNLKLLISLEPDYLLVEPQAEVELSLYVDKNLTNLIWSKTGPVITGSGILISVEDAEILKSITSEQISYKIVLRAKNYQSKQITGSAKFHIMDSVKD